MSLVVFIRGGGDLASGVALRLHRSGFKVVISELAQPLAVRRRVSFADAVYTGSINVEGCMARLVETSIHTSLATQIMAEGLIPVLIDPNGEAIRSLHPDVIVDARMLKRSLPRDPSAVKLLIGLGPGFVAGQNCDTVIETNRGISLGRVIWEGPCEENTSMPEAVDGHKADRVLRAPADGTLVPHADIGDHIESGQIIAEVGGQAVAATMNGILRGLIHPGLYVNKGIKIGDIDPRGDPRVCTRVSDKSLAVAGGVLEAILSRLRILEHSG
jgi:xanthine dehydrogenase accessory factor